MSGLKSKRNVVIALQSNTDHPVVVDYGLCSSDDFKQQSDSARCLDVNDLHILLGLFGVGTMLLVPWCACFNLCHGKGAISNWERA